MRVEINLRAALFCAVVALHAAAGAAGAGIRIVAPAEGSAVPLLNEGQKRFLDMPREPRVRYFASAPRRRELAQWGDDPLPVRLEWEWRGPEGDGRARFTVCVYRLPDRRPVFRADTLESFAEVDNLEIGREYEWTVFGVSPLAGASARGAFRTEDHPPRLIRVPGVPNVRDLGGRVGLGGRRVRQGMIYRSAGLNENAGDRRATREEMLAGPGAERFLAREGALLADLERWRKVAADPSLLDLYPLELSPEWIRFRAVDPGTESEAAAALDAVREIPRQFMGGERMRVTLDADGVYSFAKRSEVPVVFMKEFDAPRDGFVAVGFGADWWWDLRVNGELAFSRMDAESGNGHPICPDSWVLPVKVRKGRNLFVARVRPGSGGAAWCCQSRPGLTARQVAEFRVRETEDEIRGLYPVVPHTWTPGAPRLDEAGRRYVLRTLGVRTDLDLRSEGECHGMTGSPLGPEANWVRVTSWSYGDVQTEEERRAFTRVFRVFLDAANYPIDFHCIAGQDRTGTVAFLLLGLLGCDEEQLYLDWECTGFWNPAAGLNHKNRFNGLVESFTEWNGKRMYDGATLNDRIEQYVLSLGFTREEIGRFRDLMLE